jgi:hypothetical protein
VLKALADRAGPRVRSQWGIKTSSGARDGRPLSARLGRHSPGRTARVEKRRKRTALALSSRSVTAANFPPLRGSDRTHCSPRFSHRGGRWPSPVTATYLFQALPKRGSEASTALWLQQIDPMANASDRASVSPHTNESLLCDTLDCDGVIIRQHANDGVSLEIPRYWRKPRSPDIPRSCTQAGVRSGSVRHG